jgi:hypothetical protein
LIALAVGKLAGNDSIDDLAIANGEGKEITIHRGIGEGRFSLSQTISLVDAGGLLDFSSLVTGDFDGNGMMDLAVMGHDIVEPTPLAALQAIEPLGSLIYQSSAHGAIGIGGDEDIYTTNLKQGQKLTLSVQSTSHLPGQSANQFQPAVALRGPNGNLISLPTDEDGAISNVLLQNISVPADGTYQVIVSGAGGTSGTFDLELIVNASKEAEQPGVAGNDEIKFAQDINSSFLSLVSDVGASRGAVLGTADGSLPADYYRFELDVGQSADLVLTNLGSGGLQLELLNEDGTPADVDQPPSTDLDRISRFIAPKAGMYLVRVTGDLGADYSLVVTRNAAFDREPNNSFFDAQVLPASGVALVAQPGRSIPLGTNAETEPNDDGNLGITLADLAFASPLAFQVVSGNEFEASLTGILDGDSDLDAYRFEAAPGDSIVLALDGITLEDPLVRLYDRNGVELAANDDAIGLDSRLTFSNFSYAGDYYIVADRFFGTGAYALTASLLVPVGESDYYKFSASDGDTLRIATSLPAASSSGLSNPLQPIIELFAPNGSLVRSNLGEPANARGPVSWNVTADDEGVYTVRLYRTDVLSDAVYQLSVSGATNFEPVELTAAPPARAQLLKGEFNGIIGTDQTLRYSVDRTSGQLLTLAVTPDSSLRPQVIIRDPLGGEHTETASDPGTIVLLQNERFNLDGTYEIEISGVSGTTGQFSAQLYVNANIEEELFGGGPNGTVETAQEIDSDSFVGNAERAAIFGSTDGKDHFEKTITRFDIFTENNPITFNFSPQVDRLPAPVGQGTLTITAVGDLAGASLTIGDRVFELKLRENEIANTPPGARTWTVEVDPISLAAIAGGAPVVLTAAAGATNSPLNGVMLTLEYDFAADVIAEPAFTADVYRFTLADEQSASILVSAGTAVNLWLKEATQQALAGEYAAVGIANNGLVQIDSFKNTTGDEQTYLVYVSADVETNYTLVITRNPDIETEPNNASPQQLPSSGIAVGVVQNLPNLGGGDILFAVDGFADRIVAIDQVSGDITNSFSTPEPTSFSFGPQGLAFNGSGLFFINGFGSNTLFELDPVTGDVIDADPIAQLGIFGSIDALAFVDGLVVLQDYGANTLFFVDPVNDVVVRSFAIPAGIVGGLAGATSISRIFASDFSSIYELDAVTGQLLGIIPTPFASIYGLAYIDGMLYAGLPDGTIGIVDPAGVEALRTISVPASITALAGDDISQGQVDRDSFSFSANAGLSLTVSAIALPGSPGELPVIPKIEVFDPNGILIVPTNSPGEPLQFDTQLDGQYRVVVSAEVGTAGMYRLQVEGLPFNVESIRYERYEPQLGRIDVPPFSLPNSDLLGAPRMK